MSRTLVTVVTISYNKFDKLFDNIKSVLSQDYPDIEYIIADDGSTDFPKDQVIEFVNMHRKSNIRNVKYMFNAINVGTVRNLNRAYRNADGEILIPLSADDVFINETSVSRIKNCFDDSNFDVICGARLVCNQKDMMSYLYPHILNRKKIKALCTSKKQYYALLTGQFYNALSGSSLYIKKKLFDKYGGFDENYILWEDSPFMLNITRNGETIGLFENLITIRYSICGVSTDNINPLYVKDKTMYLDNIMQHIHEYPAKVQRIVLHNYKRKLCENRLSVFALYLSDIDIILNNLKNRALEKFYCVYDKYIIDRYIDTKKTAQGRVYNENTICNI